MVFRASPSCHLVARVVDSIFAKERMRRRQRKFAHKGWERYERNAKESLKAWKEIEEVEVKKKENE